MVTPATPFLVTPRNGFQFRGILIGLQNSHFPRIGKVTLYISGLESRVYHIVLMKRGRAYTLRGLKVARSKVILSEIPKNGMLCKHRERLREGKSSGSVQQ